MNIFASLMTDMRQKKLWPLALLLVALLVALPVLLSKSASPVAITPITPTPNSSGLADVPSITAQVNPVHSALRGHKRNPFTQSAKTSSPAAQTGANSPKTSTGSATKPASSSAATTHTTSTPAATTTTPATTPTQPTGPTIPVKPTKPLTTGLTPTEVYDVSFAMTNSSGGFNTVDPLERLSALPSAQKPLLVELGVLKGGNRVLFAVQSSASVSGPGTCIPGPVDCELLSMRPGQVEQMSGSTPGGMVYAEFAVTQVTKKKMRTTQTANVARQKVSAAGRSLLHNSTSRVLSLFDYKPQLGAIVDLRNLGIAGGN